ncbi:hypothetical protein Aab01nite_79510 [Paractinoplanes abujensis]|uniref:Uncharacterized protein n=1 Tax=Paractinoplanes abujensis TaxID=882441 RepID=A0A7W7G2G5_9ACTN|nr:hypothetical protein [Actinoplanes abujensis]MBB4693160.1 hypothetical protein [Actinoplanes abujensis]GID24361.1 hypothetical protein Aab01nite_79510 [Actinoplanes abujensis]
MTIAAGFALGLRLAFAGGRRGWTRTATAALGVAIGAAGPPMAASVPVTLDARHARTEARSDHVRGEVIPGRPHHDRRGDGRTVGRQRDPGAADPAADDGRPAARRDLPAARAPSRPGRAVRGCTVVWSVLLQVAVPV